MFHRQYKKYQHQKVVLFVLPHELHWIPHDIEVWFGSILHLHNMHNSINTQKNKKRQKYRRRKECPVYGIIVIKILVNREKEQPDVRHNDPELGIQIVPP